MDSLIILLILLPFVAVFVSALRTYLQRRDPVSRDLSLVFGAVSALFVLEVLRLTVGPPPPPIPRLTSALLLAQPFLTLRLVRQVRPVPRRALFVAFVAYVVTAIPVTLANPPVPVLLTLAAVTVFVATDVVAAILLMREAARRAGAVRVRLTVAALATAAFALAILVAGAGAADARLVIYATAAARFIALAAAIAYAVAFLPPAWLRRAWRADAFAQLSRRLSEIPPSAPVDELWSRFVQLARESAGAEGVAIVGSSEGSASILACDGCGPGVEGQARLATQPRSAPQPFAALEAAGAGDSGLQPIRALPPIVSELARGTPAEYGLIVPIADGGGPPRVAVVLTGRRALFADDDRDVIVDLARQTTLLVERRTLLAEQERLTDALHATVEALKAANRARSDFLASMSHELRTPLSAIIGFSELMRGEEPIDGELTVPAEWVEHIHRSGNHLLELINDVLDLTKVEAGRMELDQVTLDLGQAIGESLAGLRPLAARKGISLSSEIETPTLVADRGRFRQILYNLLSNAIKFTPEGGAIRVEARRQGHDIEIAVEDTGIGITPEDQALVFEEFRQVGDPEARQAGTGLGLALTRRLVEAHGGRMQLTSQVGLGSRFSAIFPADRVSTEARPTPATPGGAETAGEARDVLVIEDDPAGVRLLRTYLAAEGIPIRVAADGEAGLAEARRLRPGAIILDLLLPGMDGWDVLRLLKSDERLRDVPVIVVTVVDERAVGLALGATDYFVKPIDRGALIQRLTQLTVTGEVRRRPVRVLAVDDDPAALALIRSALAAESFEVVTTTRGEEALHLAQSDGIDVMICDLLMPELDGFEVVARMNASERTRDIPILILTAHELTAGERAWLIGKVLAIAAKTDDMQQELRRWLAQVLPPVDASAAQEVVAE